jgi:hypothetical protein
VVERPNYEPITPELTVCTQCWCAVPFAYMIEHSDYHQAAVSGPSGMPVDEGVHESDDGKSS